jgi:hypothetical protein
MRRIGIHQQRALAQRGRHHGLEVADEYLAGAGELHHASQLDRHVADYVTVQRGVDAFDLIELEVAADVERGAQHRHRIAIRVAGIARPVAGNGVVGDYHKHELEQVEIGAWRGVAIPYIKAVAGGGAGEIDFDVLLAQLVVGRVQRVRETVQLAGLLERRIKGEIDDIEQQHGAAVDITDAVALDQLLDRQQRVDVGLRVDLRGNGGDFQFEPARGAEEILGVHQAWTADQLPDEAAVEQIEPVDRRTVAEAAGKLSEVIMRHHQHRDAALDRAPAQQDVLPQAPMLAQCILQRDEPQGALRLVDSR